MTVTQKDAVPQDAPQLYEEGLAQLKLGNKLAARTSFEQALAVDNSLSAAHYQLGNCQRLAGDEDAAEASLRQAIALDPTLHEAYFSLAFLLRDQGRIIEIDPLLTALATALPEDAEHIEQAAGLLAEYGRFQTALSLFQRAQSLRPSLARLHLRIGQMLMATGNFSQSSEAFENAIQCEPRFGPAYLLLAHHMKAEAPDDKRIALCEAKLDLPDLPSDTRTCLHFALGKLLDDAHDFTSAFEHFHAGNQLRHRQIQHDRMSWEQFFETQSQMPAMQTSLAKQGDPTPIFIIGMLRSGTTLVDRLLSNHSTVYSLGETEMVDRLAESLAQHAGVAYPISLRRLTAEHLEMLAEQYRARWPRDSRNSRYIIDKNPLNFMHVGLIAQLFPEARFIHCKRDARDVALSIYFQHFAHERNAYAYDLANIGHFYSGYIKLMNHWQKLFPGMIYSIKYENLVDDPEREMRKLTDFLKLAWEPGCMDPQINENAISTASVWQARQPLYADSVGRWRNYATQLSAFVSALPESERSMLKE